MVFQLLGKNLEKAVLNWKKLEEVWYWWKKVRPTEYTGSDIEITVVITLAWQTILVNNYFKNPFVVDWGDWTINSNSWWLHTYNQPWIYKILLSLSWWYKRRTFWNARGPLIPKNRTTASDVYISKMPKLQDWFWPIWNDIWSYFFDNFNSSWAITALPHGSFDTSYIERTGRDCFEYFNRFGNLSALPSGSFNFENTVFAGSYFFNEFNYMWALARSDNGVSIKNPTLGSIYHYVSWSQSPIVSNRWETFVSYSAS